MWLKHHGENVIVLLSRCVYRGDHRSDHRRSVYLDPRHRAAAG